MATADSCAIKVCPPFTHWGPRCSVPPLYTSTVVLPAASAAFTSGQVIIPKSTRSDLAWPKLPAAPSAARQRVDVNVRISKVSPKSPRWKDTIAYSAIQVPGHTTGDAPLAILRFEYQGLPKMHGCA